MSNIQKKIEALAEDLVARNLMSQAASVRHISTHLQIVDGYLDDMHALVEELLTVYSEKYGKNSFVEIEARATIKRQKTNHA